MKAFDGTLIMPYEFLGAAERYDLMLGVDQWVINNVIGRMGGYIEPTSLAGMHYVAINLSGQSLASDGLLEFILDKMNNYNVDPQRLCFEITETTAIANFNQASKLVKGLQKVGCHIALDDFGSGLSSYGYIKNIPANILKIDREFIRDLTQDPINRAIVRSVIEVAHDIGMKAVAEGIEDQETYAILVKMGADYLQGYYFGKPELLPLIKQES